MAWANTKDLTDIGSIPLWAHGDLETDYVNPVTGLTLAVELKVFYFMKQRNDYQPGWTANKSIELFEPAKFTVKDWSAIAQVSEKPRSWVYQRLEEYEH